MTILFNGNCIFAFTNWGRVYIGKYGSDSRWPKFKCRYFPCKNCGCYLPIWTTYNYLQFIRVCGMTHFWKHLFNCAGNQRIHPTTGSPSTTHRPPTYSCWRCYRVLNQLVTAWSPKLNKYTACHRSEKKIHFTIQHVICSQESQLPIHTVII